MTNPDRPDPGLQPERTALAWRRTALTVALGSLVSLRALPAVLEHPIWYAPGVVGVGFAGWMWWASHRRHDVVAKQLVSSSAAVVPQGAGALMALTTFVVAVGAVAMTAVVSTFV